MDVSTLAKQLEAEGCNPSCYCIGDCGAASDAYCLRLVKGEWQIFYTERGVDGDPIYRTNSEEEACRFFFDHVMGLKHIHCVGFFAVEDRANELRDRLKNVGISATVDRIPYGGIADPRFRVFVTGKDIFAARRILPRIPMT